MRKLKLSMGILAIAFATLTVASCKDAKTEQTNSDDHNSEMSADEDHSKMTHDNSDGHHDGEEMAMSGDATGSSQTILKDYFNLKNALVSDDNGKAKGLGATLATSFGNLDVSKYTDTQKADLKDIVEDAVEHAEHISESDIAHQREHFKILSKDVIDMVAITGTDDKMYEMFCPMYDGGSPWLSMDKEVKNPYYGSKMLTCGKVQKQIN
ncbi:DUF3347 domain-containing protein [Changchengzhania lutea]|uniref:DUF3347 domain-containing protein n=1 Tax=Changchengzhania lutea TaxID=2049305 RepID=UPI00115EA0C4|nr:DUF3347 domain-containing protein [Changchengzhania lutea]